MLPVSEGRRAPLSPEIGHLVLRSLYKQPCTLFIYHPKPKLFRFFTNWAPKPQVLLSCSFLRNVLLMSNKYKLCLLRPLLTYFLGPICMDLWVHKFVSFSPVNVSCQFNYQSNCENLKMDKERNLPACLKRFRLRYERYSDPGCLGV